MTSLRAVGPAYKRIMEVAAADAGPRVFVPGPCALVVVEMDFEAKREANIPLDAVRASMAAGRFVWVDLDATDTEEARRILGGLGLLSFFDGFGAVPRLIGTGFRLLLLLLFASLAMVVARGSVERSAQRVSDNPVKAALVGVAAELLFVPVLVLTCIVLSISIVGIPLLLTGCRLHSTAGTITVSKPPAAPALKFTIRSISTKPNAIRRLLATSAPRTTPAASKPA